MPNEEKLCNIESKGAELKTTRIPERMVWFKHDTGHVNMAFIDYDG